jgi:hypothetical protein
MEKAKCSLNDEEAQLIIRIGHLLLGSPLTILSQAELLRLANLIGRLEVYALFSHVPP